MSIRFGNEKITPVNKFGEFHWNEPRKIEVSFYIPEDNQSLPDGEKGEMMQINFFICVLGQKIPYPL
jgi:hypothetical protein